MILLLTPFYLPNIGGVEIHLADYVEYLKKEGREACVLTYQPITTHKKAPIFERCGQIKIWRFPYPGFNLFYRLEKHPGVQFLYLFSGIFLYSFLFMLFNQKQVEVIHSHGLASALAGGLLGKIFKKKAVVSLHTIYKFSNASGNAPYARWILGLNGLILVVSQGCQDDLVKIGVEERKIRLYGYWVNTDKFRPLSRSECRKDLGLPENVRVALFVGRFTPEKQVKEALQAASLAPQVDCLFVGQGPLEEEIKKYAQKFKNIKLVGRVENDEIPLYHNAADILLLGSVDEDYFGKVSLEAMASGLPILITNESHYFDQHKKINPGLLPESCGFMVPLDPQKIARKLRGISRRPEALRSLRRGCRRYALKHFGICNARVILDSYV